ncbi:hypothetical protein J5X84_22165 [Streptosporangiaceae bacterium NEAU-GS5]|nr:hypothetical protein [Streptosporangiaceae bacterium NEAU-GS5]
MIVLTVALALGVAGLVGFLLVVLGIRSEERWQSTGYGPTGPVTRLARWATGYHVITGQPDCDEWPACQQRLTSAATELSETRAS